MIGHQVPTALRAILTLAKRGLLERRQMLGARFNPGIGGHVSKVPEPEVAVVTRLPCRRETAAMSVLRCRIAVGVSEIGHERLRSSKRHVTTVTGLPVAEILP